MFDVLFCHCKLFELTILHQLELRRNVKRKPFVRVVLRRDCDFVLPILSKVLSGVVLDKKVFPTRICDSLPIAGLL